MLYPICFALFLPLLGFLGLVAVSKLLERKWAGIIACGTVLISFIAFSGILLVYETHAMNPITLTVYPWIHLGNIHADFSLYLDSLSLLMALIITGVGFLIHVYSLGYMEHDEDFLRYFACLNLFIFAMLLLVLAADLLLLFVGWEGVGLASYLLIGFWYDRPSAAKAATKAFIVNRIGDLGFLIALLLTFSLFNTSNISAIVSHPELIDSAPLMVLTLLLFIGAIGKSAQLPLHVWLPDAMEGPTPVSALIHAATMVTAGVYLVVRMHPLFLQVPEVLQFIGYLGAVTALFAALCAVGQSDLKRVLAYSTVSQLGLMFLACGVGAFYAAMFHLTTHAFVKALLFLAAGNVVHMMHGTTEMASMGGLWTIFKRTHWLFLIGVLAMSGIPPLAAFFSKDLILEQAERTGFEILFYLGLIVSILTAFYLLRAYILTFLGKMNSNDLDVREAPKVMLLPVSVLAFLSIVGGFLGFCIFCKDPLLERFLAQSGVRLAVDTDVNLSFLFTLETVLSTLVALLGAAGAIFMYMRHANLLGRSFQILKKAFYIDEIYNKLLVQPLKRISSYIADNIEPKFFEGSITIVAKGADRIAHVFQGLQSGQIRSYVAWMVIGSVFVIAYLVF